MRIEITIRELPDRCGVFEVRSDGRLLCRSRQPLCDGARALLLDAPADTIVSVRHVGADHVALTATIAAAAALDVEETAHGPKFRRHRKAPRSALKAAPARRNEQAATMVARPSQRAA